MERIGLNTHFTYRKILRQCLAPILMMIFTSLYVAVDGLFISKFVGADAFAGINLIAPVMMIVGGLGFMFGSGGAALAGKLLGEKKQEDASRVFTMMIEATFALVFIISLIAFFFVDDIVAGLAKISPDTTEEMVKQGTLYGRILICGQPLFALQNMFHSFFVTDEHPEHGFYQTFASGIMNIILDTLFIVVFKWGVAGAAIGTVVGYLTGTVYAFVFFLKKKNNLLTIKWCKPSLTVLKKSTTNGASDFIFNIASSVVGFLFNIQLLKIIGQNGINAYGVIMYVSFIFVSIFIGIAIGMSPVISYNYGAKNHDELKNVIQKCLNIVGLISLVMFILCEALANPFAMLFNHDQALIELTARALRLYAFSFLFSGFCIMITSMFTALNNGFISGLLSFLRTLVFEIGLLFILPLIFGQDGLWWTVPVCELMSVITCVVCYFTYRKRYNY